MAASGVDPFHLVDEIAAGFVEGFGGHRDRVERVETDRSVRCFLPGRFRVGGTEVHRDRFQFGGFVGPELFEELLQGGRGAVFGTPDHITGVVVDDEGQILVAAFPGDLVDTDVDEPLNPGEVRCRWHDPFDDRVDGPPRHPTQHRRCGAVHRGDTPDDEVLEVVGDTGTGASEWHLLGSDPVGRAPEPAQRTGQDQRLATHVEVSPLRRFGAPVIDRHRRVVAVRTPEPPAGEADGDRYLAGIEVDCLHKGGVERQKLVECGGDAHG